LGRITSEKGQIHQETIPCVGDLELKLGGVSPVIRHFRDHFDGGLVGFEIGGLDIGQLAADMVLVIVSRRNQ
jgi:hypothetical protein